MVGIRGFGVIDEVFHPAAANARDIREIEAILPAPTPLPGDPPWDLDSGRVVLVLPVDPGPASPDVDRPPGQ